MTKINSTAQPRARKAIKPKKPKDSPLFPHANGQWAKKVRQKMHFFGVWADHQAALNRWLDEKDDLLAGRVPRCRSGVVQPTLRDLVNQFLTTKKRLQDAGELSPYTFKSYFDISEELCAGLGRDRQLTDILPADLEILREKWAKRWGPVRMAAEINRAKVILNHAWKIGIIDRPIRFAESFTSPSKKVMRLHRAAQGPNMLTADELRKVIASVKQPIKAMVLLGVNAGLGNSDIGKLSMTHLDLDGGWLTYPRPKTGIERRAWLWPETVEALREWLAMRPAPRTEEVAGLVFLTFRGKSWTPNLTSRPLTNEIRKVFDELGIKGRSFYSLRHNLETIGGEVKDQPALDAIMGHDDGGMSSMYREGIGDDRLKAVAVHVRQWLFGAEVEGGAA